MEVKIYDLENKEYLLMGDVMDGNTKYLLLVNRDDDDDIMFRKVDGVDIIPLDNEEEVAKVIQLFDQVI